MVLIKEGEPTEDCPVLGKLKVQGISRVILSKTDFDSLNAMSADQVKDWISSTLWKFVS